MKILEWTYQIKMSFVRVDLNVLDLFVLQLTKIGFKIIDALEPSSGMLEKAREKGLYRKYICEAIGTEPLNILSGSK